MLFAFLLKYTIFSVQTYLVGVNAGLFNTWTILWKKSVR